MARSSILHFGNVLLDAMQRNPASTLADLREEIVHLEDDLEQLVQMWGDEMTLEDVFRRMSIQQINSHPHFTDGRNNS